MDFIETGINGLWVIQPKVFSDSRGYFFESYQKKYFLERGLNLEFVQDNQSLSSKNVLRGLHFQSPPFAQGKLVRVIKGSVLDVVVDIRQNSETYGHHFSVKLTEQNFRMLWVPVGFAHGFLTLEDDTIFAYKCTEGYEKSSEQTILWNDLDLKIDWQVQDPILSEKDKMGTTFKDFVSPFL